MKTKNNECGVCGDFIDKSDASRTWISVNKKMYFDLGDTEEQIPHERVLLCAICGLSIMSKIDALKKIQNDKAEHLVTEGQRFADNQADQEAEDMQTQMEHNLEGLDDNRRDD